MEAMNPIFFRWYGAESPQTNPKTRVYSFLEKRQNEYYKTQLIVSPHIYHFSQSFRIRIFAKRLFEKFRKFALNLSLKKIILDITI